MIVSLSTAPGSEPVSLSDAKDHLRVSTNDFDSMISGYITAARLWAERFTGRVFITQTWKYYFEDFPYGGEEFKIPKPPLQSVSSISYIDSSGSTQTWSSSNYTVDTDSNIGTAYPNYGVIYPTPRDIEKAVTVTFVAGYGDPEDVPQPIIEAIKLQIQVLYEQPIGPDKDAMESARDSLLWPYRIVL